jgi:hypothetical protein
LSFLLHEPDAANITFKIFQWLQKFGRSFFDKMAIHGLVQTNDAGNSVTGFIWNAGGVKMLLSGIICFCIHIHNQVLESMPASLLLNLFVSETSIINP